MSVKHLVWAKSEAEQRELEALGWKPADQRRTHHSAHAMLMEWAKDGEPKLPERAAHG